MPCLVVGCVRLSLTSWMKRASASSDDPSKKIQTRTYSSHSATQSTIRGTQYTQLRDNGRGRLTQRRTNQTTTIPLVPDDLDPDEEINKWVDDAEPTGEGAGTTQTSSNSTTPPELKQKKRHTRLVCVPSSLFCMLV